MASINRIILAGNLTRDPVLRKTPGGVSVCDMRLAVSERFKSASGDPQERTLFIDVVVWERQADNCAKYLAKGSSVIIDGRLRQEDYKTKEGENRTKISVIAQNVQFIGSPAHTASPTPPPPPVDDDDSGDNDDDDAPPF